MIRFFRSLAQVSLFVFLFDFVATPYDKAETVKATSSVYGRVTNLSGEPLSNGEVTFYKIVGNPEAPKRESLSGQFKTDQNGNYKTGKLAWGFYRVHITGRDYCCSDVTGFFLAEGKSRILDIGVGMALTHGLAEIKIAGTVLGPNQPIEDATVTLVSAYNPYRWDQTRTKESGKYEFMLRQPGHYVVYASKPGFMTSATSIDLAEGASLIKDINLKQGSQ